MDLGVGDEVQRVALLTRTGLDVELDLGTTLLGICLRKVVSNRSNMQVCKESVYLWYVLY